MRSATRTPLTTALALACSILACSTPPALAAFGLSKWEAGTCTSSTCTSSTPEQFYTTASGHPPFGITDFALNTNSSGEPEGHIEKVRVDIPPGLSVDPLATPQCKLSELEGPGCPPDTKVGEVQLTAHLNTELLGLKAGTTVGPPFTDASVYNMQPPPGTPLEAAFKVNIFETIVHIVGGIEWSNDYHEFFTIEKIPTTPELVESRLIFDGRAIAPGGTLPFITMPSTCVGPQTSYIHVASYEGQQDSAAFTTPVGASGCAAIPFNPTIKVTPPPGSTQSDQPDPLSVKVEVPHDPSPEGVDSSTLADARVTLPEGLTLNPSAAANLEACSDQQFAKHSTAPVTCPPASQIGTVAIETPDLPPQSLTGSVYLGQPLSTSPESGQEYRIFIDASSPRYGVSVRLEGHTSADATNGRLTTAVLETPQVPFSDFTLTFSAGPHTPLANPLICGPATTTAALTPYSGTPAANPFALFAIDFDGKGSACPPTLPFALTQSAASTPTTGGSPTSFAYNLARAPGQQYLAQLATTLPPGLLGKIPAVTLCPAPQSASGTCPSTSQIGTATVSFGAGPTPYALSSPVFLTGPYAGAPYGLSVATPADKVGPFDYGTIVTRATITIDPYTARITVATPLPTIVGGVPVRLRSLNFTTTRPNFMLNPTNCAPLALTTTLTSTFGTTQNLSSPFQATGCDALAFTPKLSVSSTAPTSKLNGIGFGAKLTFPAGAQANVKSVLVTLPKQLPSRLSTLNHACPQATFAANPLACPPSSRVGEATVLTPVLPHRLSGPAMFVSHGGGAFPDLDILLQGDGVTVILVGNTNITKGITSSNFAALPDVPVSSFVLTLPAGRNSALSAVGNICKPPLHMPTTITAQNGKVIKQNTKISLFGCPLTILSRRVRHHAVIIALKVPSAGRLSARGRGLRTVHKHPRKAQKVTLRVPLSRTGLRLLRAHRHLAVRVRIGFLPSAPQPSSTASVRVLFR
jgi:hypothetical protein